MYYQLSREEAEALLLALFKSRRVKASERDTKGNSLQDQMTWLRDLTRPFSLIYFDAWKSQQGP